jgi:hypothetical protein
MQKLKSDCSLMFNRYKIKNLEIEFKKLDLKNVDPITKFLALIADINYPIEKSIILLKILVQTILQPETKNYKNYYESQRDSKLAEYLDFIKYKI